MARIAGKPLQASCVNEKISSKDLHDALEIDTMKLGTPAQNGPATSTFSQDMKRSSPDDKTRGI